MRILHVVNGTRRDFLGVIKMELVEVPPGAEVNAELELYSHGHVYAAKDRRRQYLIIGQRLSAIRDVIVETVGEEVALSSLYVGASHSLRKGYTRSFMIERLPLRDLKDFSSCEGRRFERVLIAAHQPTCWKVEAPPVHPQPIVV